MTTEIQWDLYPDIISCEQLRLMLHISKRRAAWLLQQQVIKCQIVNDNVTWKYLIAKSDIQVFVQKIKKGELIPPARPSPSKKGRPIFPSLDTEDFRNWLADKWAEIPDLLYNNDVCRLTGYSKSAVDEWLLTTRLKSVMIPDDRITSKAWLIDYYSTTGYEIKRKSSKHIQLLKQYFEIE